MNVADLLAQAIALLEAHGERTWAGWLRDDRARILGGDQGGVTHLLAAFGGMGSLNDIVFDPINGNAETAQSGLADTERLRDLLTQIHAAASAAQRGPR